MTERVRKFKEEFLRSKPLVTTERLRFIPGGYNKTGGKNEAIKRTELTL